MANENTSRVAEGSGRSSIEELEGRGRLVPAQATGIEYPVEFGARLPGRVTADDIAGHAESQRRPVSRGTQR